MSSENAVREIDGVFAQLNTPHFVNLHLNQLIIQNGKFGSAKFWFGTNVATLFQTPIL